MEFLSELIKVSEKAANVARTIRQNEHLFALLVQQKEAKEANPRFVDDFKTLADVLIQEMIKHDIGKKFPSIKDYIQGEESNIFSNKLGETVCIEVKEEVLETALLLETVLNGDKIAAILLAEEVHKEVDIDSVDTARVCKDFDLDIENLGIWIDPIDSTAEYINGTDKKNDNIYISGLRCVTVLIGAYNRLSGEAITGVLNQPFLYEENGRWRGRCVWGVSTDVETLTSLSIPNVRNNVVCLSSSETEEVKRKLRERAAFNLLEAAGAGYKIFAVISGLADGYVLSKDSTFKWDTCGPQAILKSLGGDVVNFVELERNNVISLKYTCRGDPRCKVQSNCNNGGIVAYRNRATLKDIIECLVPS